MSLFALTLTSRVTTTASPDVVRETFEDAASWPEWCSAVVEVQHAPAVWAAGQRLCYRLASVFTVTFDVRIDQVDARQIRWSSSKGPIRGVRTFTFEPGVVVDEKRFESWLPVALFYPRPPIRRMSERWLADLAHEAERRMQ